MDILSSTEFDEKFKQSNILYYPWVGQEYSSTNPKILILGESHYYGKDCKKEEKENIDKNQYFTRNCYSEQYTSFTNTQALLANNLLENEYIAKKIAFYNFFSRCIGFAPSDKQFVKKYLEESRELFFTILNILEPQIVIVWGTSNMWKWMPTKPYTPIHDKAYYYDDFPKIKIIHIKHPSWNKDLCKTAKILKDFFEKNMFSYPIKN